MAKRNVPTAIEEVLVSNQPFEYAHLIKFERPFKKNAYEDNFRTNANRYAYFTDASRDISFNDGSIDHDGNANGSQVYRANRVRQVGQYSETTAPRATAVSLILSGEHLATSVSVIGDFSNGQFALDTTFYNGDIIDLVEEGFREGDKIKITKNLGNFTGVNKNIPQGTSPETYVSTVQNNVTYIITGFSNSNRTIALATTGNDTESYQEGGDTTAYPSDTNTAVSIELLSEELRGGLTDKGTDLLANPSFLNREVFIHKIFIDSETGDLLGNTSILLFKGIIAQCSVDEGATSSSVKWGLTSHWGDWAQVGGRLTTDDNHRALDGNGAPQGTLTIKPEYATDLGFIHSETTLSTIATYKTYETETITKQKSMGGLGGLFGLKKSSSKEIQVEVENDVNLNIGLQGKYLPVVYGVQRISAVPIFADTDNILSKQVFVASALCEGEIHGIYNLYVDGTSLVCGDGLDFGVRAAGSGSGRDEAQLQCYGRADKGNTIGGANNLALATAINGYVGAATSSSAGLVQTSTAADDAYHLYAANWAKDVKHANNTIDISNLTTSVQAKDAEGLGHEQNASISHPHDVKIMFHKGSTNQNANDLLVTKALANTFKRQVSYYDGELPYWSANHRVLDTAYVVSTYDISADQTEIPEIEYVVRGRVIECYNFDNSYIPDPRLGAGDAHTNFLEGDIVTVEKSSNGSSWSTTNVQGTASDTSFRILHKYLLTKNDGTQHYRLLLDQTPDLDAVNGVPTQTYLRIKKTGTANYWHMNTYNHTNISNQPFPLYRYSPTAVSKDGNNQITCTFTSNDATILKAAYTSEISGQPGLATYSCHIGTCLGLKAIQDQNMVGTWSGNVLTLVGVKYTGDISSVSNLTAIKIFPDTKFKLTGVSGISAFNNNADLTGATITLLHSGESRNIVSWVASELRLVVDSPFQTLTEEFYEAGHIKFDIKDRAKDTRSVTNTALQLLDYMSDSRYGKNLDVNNDIDLASFISSAKLCEARGTVELYVQSITNVAVGDYYKLVDSGSNHMASGRVKSINSSEKSITLENMSGKFIRGYGTHIYYADKELFYSRASNSGSLYIKSGAGHLTTRPTHTSGTTNGATYVSAQTYTLTKESGSGPSTLTVRGNQPPIYSLYDSDFVKYWRYVGWEHHKQCYVTRHQTNFIIDTSKSIFENMNVFLSHMNGMLSYESGKYVLDIETQASAPVATTSFNSTNYDWNINPEYIDETDIIGKLTITENSSRKAKNTIKASIPDPHNNWGSRSVSFYNSEYLEADRKIVKTGNFNFTGITNYYNGRIGAEKELNSTRFGRETSFKLGPKGMLLKAGQVISLNYTPFGFTNKLFRINNLNFASDCTVAVKATEYNDSMYIITAQRANELRQESNTQAAPLAAPGAPTGLTCTTDKPGTVIIEWVTPTDFIDESDDVLVYAHDSNNRPDKPQVIYRSPTNNTASGVKETFSYTTAGAGTKFYWVQTRRLAKRGRGTTYLTSAYHPTSPTGGVTGTSKILSPDIQLSHGSINFLYDSSGVLDPVGSNQDVTISATLQNLSGTPTFSIVEPNGSSQSDVTFTNGATSLTASSATVDASSSSASTSPKLLKVTITDTTETFTRQVPISIITSGSGSVGTNARAVSLIPGDQSIEYNTNGTSPDPSSTTITATAVNTTGTVYYQFFVNGSSVQNTTSNTYSYTPQSLYANMPDKVEVHIRESSSSGDILARDIETISGLKAGVDAMTIILSNEAHTVPVSTAGNITFTNSGTDIEVYSGTNQLNYGTSGNSTFSVAAASDPIGVVGIGAASTVSSNIRRFAAATSLSQDTGQIVFTITTRNEAGKTQIFTRKQTITKSKQGATGAAGAVGRTVKLIPSKHVINYSTAGAESDSITFTNEAFNFTTPYYRFLVGGVEKQAYSTTSTFTLADADEPAIGGAVQVQVLVKENNTGNVAASDVVSIFAVQDGSDAVTGFLTNASHSVTADVSGAVSSFSGAGGTFKVFVGGTEVTTSCTFSATSGTGVAASINSSSGVYTVSSMSANQGTKTFQAVIPAATAGTASNVTITADYSISKSLTGASGASVTGPAGLRTIQGYLYYEKTSSGAPSAPSGTTYTFSTGVVSGTGINDSGSTNVWRNSPTTQNLASSNGWWTVRYYGTESSAGSSTITVAYSGVVQLTSFTGVVTFSGGTFNDGNDITTIDGGNIAASSTITVGADGKILLDGGNNRIVISD